MTKFLGVFVQYTYKPIKNRFESNEVNPVSSRFYDFICKVGFPIMRRSIVFIFWIECLSGQNRVLRGIIKEVFYL